MASNEILMEVHRYGTILRVTAVDAATGTEIVFQAPASSSKAALQNLAASKLRYVLSKGGEGRG
jgi:predicted acylesterase/phospholipase RssA